MDYEHSPINDQVENGIAARMAVLCYLKPEWCSFRPGLPLAAASSQELIPNHAMHIGEAHVAAAPPVS